MNTKNRPASLLAACALILLALLTISMRTCWDLHVLARTRDELTMSAMWAEAVWCNVTVWVGLGMPLLGAWVGWNFCRFIVAAIAGLLGGSLIYLIVTGAHSLSPWAIAIVLLQALGTLLLFIPPTTAFYTQYSAA